MPDWLKNHDTLLWSLGTASVVMFVASLIVLPAIVVRIPADYFAHVERPRDPLAGRSLRVRIVLLVLKNLLGFVLILAGIAMLVLPGQGLLTILIGLFLVDGPGKYRLERWLIARPAIHRPLNWLRRRRGRAPLEWRPPEAPAPGSR